MNYSLYYIQNFSISFSKLKSSSSGIQDFVLFGSLCQFLNQNRVLMGCVSSTLLSNDEDFSQIGGNSGALIGHHIVSLTSTTYGLLNLDPPTPPPPFSLAKTSTFEPPTRSLLRSDPPEIINSWELMAGLLDPTTANDTSSRFSPSKRFSIIDIENSNPNLLIPLPKSSLKPNFSLDGFEKLCPPNGENRVVIYTTTLRGVRKTFEACNAVRAAFQGFGVSICERDISMDRGFKEELRELMKGKDDSVPPRVFVKGRYVGGAEEVMGIVEEGYFGELVHGLPKLKNKAGGYVCEGCGGIRFLPCFRCNGSCKLVKEAREINILGPKKQQNNVLVVKCSDCNENGLVVCPICS